MRGQPPLSDQYKGWLLTALQMSKKLTYDTWLFGAAMLLVVVGIVMIYSASAMIATQRFGVEHPYHFMTRQLVWLVSGGALMLILMHLDTSLLRDRRLIYLAMAGSGIALDGTLPRSINGKIAGFAPWFQLQRRSSRVVVTSSWRRFGAPRGGIND